MLVKQNAIVSITPSADHSEKEGYFVKLVAGLAALCSATTDIPFGVIIDGEVVTAQDSIAVGAAYPGIVTVKLSAAPGDVVAGSRLTLNADGSVSLDDGAGPRVIVAVAIESGAADELIQAVLIRPVSIGNAVVLGSTNGTMAAAADLAAVKAEGELQGDDIRALYAALQAAGILA